MGRLVPCIGVQMFIHRGLFLWTAPGGRADRFTLALHDFVEGGLGPREVVRVDKEINTGKN